MKLTNINIMKVLSGILSLTVFAVLSLVPETAHAAPTVCAGATGSPTFGEVICNTMVSIEEVPGLFAGLSYVIGITMGALGVMKLYEHVQNPHQTPVWDSLKRFLVGGAMFSLPFVLEAVQRTLFTDGTSGQIDGSGWNGAVTAGGLDEMVVRLVSDTMNPMGNILWGFCYLAGIILVMIGIMRLLKTAQEGPRGPGGIGTIMTFIVAGALLSIDQMLGAWSNSMFDTETVTHYGELAFTTGMGPAEIAHVHAVISAILGFVMILGWISFIRGWFILRDVAEGNQQASMMAAMTHIFGGALAVNLGPVLNAVQETFGLTAVGIEFT